MSSSPVRTASGERSRVGDQPHCPPPPTQRTAAVREEGGVVDRPPLVAPQFPSAVAGVPLPCRESLRGDGRVRGPFHSA